ncbi:hypothetical protein RND81_14G002900 [Saponaria officinalis]
MNLLNVLRLSTIWNIMFAAAPSVITFNLNMPQNYQTFVAQVRDTVADHNRNYYGLPIIKAPDSKNKHLYIQVNAAAQGQKPAISVTLQLRTSDLYIVAYRDKDNLGKDRAFYFKDMIAAKDVFPDMKNIHQELTKCNPDYRRIQSEAKIDIKDLEFRLPNLEDAMRKAYGMISRDKNFEQRQALFMLYSIQMVSEAARFKYIEQKTVKQLPSDVEVASLVNEWLKLSEQIVPSKDGRFKTPIDIRVAENPTKIWTVRTVAEIKPDIGILGYVRPTMRDSPIAEEI